MPRFWFAVEKEHLERVMAILNGVGIPTIGVFPAHFGEGPAEAWDLFRLTAAVDAYTADKAEARLRDALPEGYTLERRERPH